VKKGAIVLAVWSVAEWGRIFVLDAYRVCANMYVGGHELVDSVGVARRGLEGINSRPPRIYSSCLVTTTYGWTTQYGGSHDQEGP